MLATNLTRTSQFRSPTDADVDELRPRHLNELKKFLNPTRRTALPIRPVGSNSATTDCNRAVAGSRLYLDALNDIVNIDNYNHTVTARAGVRLKDLVDELAEHGLELAGCYDLNGRTIGGAVAAPCFGTTIGTDSGSISSQVVAMKIVTPNGEFMKIDSTQKNLLAAFRQSYGLLGVIFEVTLAVRPIRTFAVTHRRVTIDKFTNVIDTLSASPVGFRFHLQPYRDKIFLDIRRYDTTPGNSRSAPWKIKDWGESTVLPSLVRSVNKIVPINSMKYRLIDQIGETTQNLVNSRLVTNGTNAACQSARGHGPSEYSSTWCFPAVDFSMVLSAYRDFCLSTMDESGYRCDLPAVGFRLNRDATSPLSPSFDEPMIALTTASTQEKGWDDFVIDLAEFSEKWGGVPLMAQSRALRAEHVIQAYNQRLDFFRRLRRQLDPEDRLLNPFMAQFAQ
ncbi:MAG: FAD-binding oxidoreductase [Pseudomonadota bacterium]